jgi:predicted DNA-binding ribbon-helix-helix protein
MYSFLRREVTFTMQAPPDRSIRSPRRRAQGDEYANPGEMRKRSVVIAGHRTSVSLENAFWEALKAEASARGQTVNQIITGIDKQRFGNLSSAIRLFVLRNLQTALEQAHPPAS